MIKMITGKKGTGKTKVLIDMINNAAQNTSGDIVCVEKSMKLTFDINHSVRLIDAEEYEIEGFDMFYGFIAGILASNFDIAEIFVDGILKIGGRDYEELGKLLAKVDKLSGKEVKVVFTVSADESELPESVLKYKD